VYILGLSCYYHDSAAVILQDGVLIAAAEEERFSRKKHDHGFPQHAIDFCLEEAGITKEDLDYVVFYEKPLLKFERILQTTMQTFPQSWGVFRESMIGWFNEKLWVKGEILTKLDMDEDKVLFVEHHLSHAASAFFCSPFEEAAIVTVDGVGEWTTTTVGKGEALWETLPNGDEPTITRNHIDLFEEVRFPHSLGLIYSTFTAFLGFRVNNGEYKVMGMSPYGRPNRMEDVYKLMHVEDNGSFRLDMDYFAFHRSTTTSYSNKFLDLFGKARVHDSTFYTPTTNPEKDHPDWNDAIAQENQEYADIAASIQRVTEETVLKMVRHAHEVTGSKNLCMAGGVALNSVANGRILREGPLFVMEHAYWGKAHTPDDVITAANAMGYNYGRVEDVDEIAALMVEDLLAGKVISLFQGRFEWGPRALGNRSILADPRGAEMKGIVNERIKFREPFRPFAPAVLEERANDFWHDLGDVKSAYPLRYMLSVCKTKEEQESKIQAVSHLGSGRIQTVRSEWNPLYHRAIELFGEATGVPILLNTSYNLRGEPIVNTPANALNTFHASGIDTLYMDGFVIRK